MTRETSSECVVGPSYPKIFAKKWPILWNKPDLCFAFGGAGCAAMTGPPDIVGSNPGAGVVATVAALSGVAIPEGVPVGTVCFGAEYASVLVASE